MGDHLFSEPRQNILYHGILCHEGIDASTLDRITSGDYQVREDDILVASYPKSGTNWALRILTLLCRLDEIDEVHKIPMEHLHGFLEWTTPGEGPLIDILADMSSPRVMKTHLPPSFLANQNYVVSRKTKIVCIMRNPKDVLVSYYHFSRMCGYLGSFTGTWSEFFELFKSRQLPFGDWFDIVLAWWQYRDQYDILYVYYEDLQKNASENIRKIASFIGKDMTDDQLQRITELSSFRSMQDNGVLKTLPKLNQDISPFMRKGMTGDWINYFTLEQNRYVDELYQKKIFGSGLDFKFIM